MGGPRYAAPWLVAAAVVALGLILRGPIIAVAPVVGQIQADLYFTAAQAGLLTSVPVLCFALVTPAAAFLLARVGPDLATTLAILGVVLGVIVRSVDGPVTVVAGTLILGAFITVGNVVVPVLIRREVAPERARLATALYSCALNLGSVLGTFVTAPLAELAGWRVALGWWAVFTLGILALWLVAEGRRGLVREPRTDAAPVLDTAERAALRRRDRFTGALLSIAFIGQTFAYYGVSAWMPTVLEDRLGFGLTEAGAAATVFQLLGIAGSIGVPLFARRIGLRAVAVTMAVTWLTVPLGLLLAPEGWLAWSIIGGVAQGAGISLMFILVVEIARDGAQAGRLSAVSQGVGYGFGGATAPAVLGAVHDATGSWDLPLVLITLALVLFGTLITWTVVRSDAAAAERRPA
ncbi:MAG: transporter [Naasia sp.]|nr:transporter [Naasia sp.]